ncbi:hypothetical protein A9179_16650 [Pseudomonas alcaligenes]|uniref:Maltoporin n=1 Tax=Aquipseudomonas alcaligenes TaxID=43263 RepID=A0ABR7S4H6_AQUAC|nr:hypothetical protein [Pseudomonas alcaligenes]MBC9251902.1 hypothetical protein [Pseudomonas alcaligenes]
MQRKWLRFAPFLGPLLLASGLARGLECSAGGFAGVEGGGTQVREAQLNPDEDFTQAMGLFTTYGEVNGDCTASAMKLHFNGYGERLESYGDNGVAQEHEGYESRGFVREAYVSLNPGESLFIDLGKKDIRNGQFFFVSPLDFLQNPSNYASRGISNGLGVSWRDTYREGSLVAQSSWFSQNGTLELAVVPQLANAPEEGRVADWTSAQRTNSAERYYAAYTTALWEDFNPRLVMVGGENKGLGIGTSGFLDDDWILNVELAVSDKSPLREPGKEALGKLQVGGFPQADELFTEQQKSEFYQFGAGLRYTTASNLAISLEYLFQDQGWGKDDWDNYFDTLEVNESAYQKSGFAVYRGYQLLAVQEADNMARRDVLTGRQYLMTHLDKSNLELRSLSWESSTIYNVEDQSFTINVHLSSQLSRHFEVYVGGAYLGGPDRSEFGRLATSGVGYAGIRTIW